MALQLLCGRWWPILCPTYGAISNVQKVLIHGVICTLLQALTNTQGSIRLHVVHLVTQGPIGSPALVQCRGIDLVVLF